jgi:bidirectional [NiFe] hydrogenase diaphorase subunit
MAVTTSIRTEPPAADPRVKAVVIEIKRHRARPDALLEVLHRVQEVYGYLPMDLLWFLARRLKLPPSRVFGVATFYHFFTLKPKGRHTCVTCLGTACHIKGANSLLAAIENEAGTRTGTTSEDGSVSVQTARCLGACGLAPVVIYDGAVTGHQTPDTSRDRVREWRHGTG